MDSDREELELLRDAAKAERYQTMRERGRQIGGVPGAIVAGLMVALRDIYESPKRGDGDVVVDAPTDPHDVDRDGLSFAAADVGAASDVTIDAQPHRPPILGSARRRSRWRRR